jgi:hypothetical protein
VEDTGCEGSRKTNSCELPDGERFCDSDCRDDWQKEQNIKKISGRG